MNEAIPWNWKHIFLFLWSILCLSADLKVSLNPRVHWVASAILLLPVMFVAYRQRKWLQLRGFYAPVLLLVAVLITACTSSQPLYDITEMWKFGMIFVAMPFFVTWPEYAKTAFYGFIGSAWLNMALLVLGLTLFPAVAPQMAIYRWGDILNFPGSLEKTGILLFAYAAYRGLGAERFSLKHIILLTASVMIVFLDGGRTGMLALGLGVVYVCSILAWEQRWKRAVLAFAVMTTIILGAGFAAPSRARLVPIIDSVAHLATGSRHGAVTPAPTPAPPAQQGGSVQSSDSQPDSARMEMIRVGLSQIAAHPFFGSGLGSTKAKTSYGVMVIHNAYLQVWADAGLLGFIAYVWLVLGWIVTLPRAARNLRKMEPARRSIYYGAIFMLIYFAWAGLFHPVSSEWSEWITFLIPYALYWEALAAPTPGNISADTSAA